MTPLGWQLRRLLPLCVLATVFGGCVSHVGHFAMLADFPIQAVEVDEDVEELPRVTGEDCMNVFVLFPFEDPPAIDNALQAALARTAGDVLVDVEVTKEWFFIPFVYGYRCYRVTGQPVRMLHGPARERTRASRLLQGGDR